MPSQNVAPLPMTDAMELAEGKRSLKEVRGYSDEGLHAVARQAIILFQQGKQEDARKLFQGLSAVNPSSAYFARLLGVAECAARKYEAALAAFDVAVRLEPEEPAGYVGRAEVLVMTGHRARAIEDLKRAVSLDREPRMTAKARAMLWALRGI